MGLKYLHRVTGLIISVFIAAHLLNHLAAWFGIGIHRQVMDTLRQVYRRPVAEVLLIACFLFQVYSGFRLAIVLRRKPKRSAYERLQVWSGVLFGLFILQHIGATLIQRSMYHTDTNFYFAARVVLLSPYKFYFIPYYFTGILALGVHVANTHRQKINPFVGAARARIHFYIIIALFTAIAIMILYLLTGGRYAIVIPPEYNLHR